MTAVGRLDAESLAVRAELLKLGRLLTPGNVQHNPALSEGYRRRDELWRRYREWLPEIPLTRDPHSGAALHWPLDPVDLDGWFWNHEAPVRRVPVRLPRLWLTLTGAMRISEPVTYAPFTCEPGPGAPYVVPRILEAPDVRAVISEVPVGRHTGWAVAYFGPLPSVPLENEWGGHEYYVYDDNGEWKGWSEHTPQADDWDFDLRPWLASGRLLWIVPGDSALTLREGAASCPYVGIEGPYECASIRNGKLTYH
ncbi:hypothetical protein [Actinomadura sp. 3N508]|uniref:hypothetical protein n=1 Tax=Actinomadura sp. 3N508 TaxID=3375153 RepID=UPI0037B99228